MAVPSCRGILFPREASPDIGPIIRGARRNASPCKSRAFESQTRTDLTAVVANYLIRVIRAVRVFSPAWSLQK